MLFFLHILQKVGAGETKSKAEMMLPIIPTVVRIMSIRCIFNCRERRNENWRSKDNGMVYMRDDENIYIWGLGTGIYTCSRGSTCSIQLLNNNPNTIQSPLSYIN